MSGLLRSPTKTHKYCGFVYFARVYSSCLVLYQFTLCHRREDWDDVECKCKQCFRVSGQTRLKFLKKDLLM